MAFLWTTIQRLALAGLFLALTDPGTEIAASPSSKPAVHKVTANAALLWDLSGRRKYYSRDINQKVPPASTTKVMTALLVMERLKLDSFVTVGPRPPRALPSKIHIRQGEKYRVRDLLHAILLSSSNDAAVALAEAVAGSEKKFVRMMNEKAQKMGAKHTVFANAHGLPSTDPQYTTAHDMYLIFREALKKKFFREAIRLKYKTIHSQGGRRIFLKTHNKALFKGWARDIYGKTGYTRAAQACFVGMIEKGKETLIIAVFGCSDRWGDVKHLIEKYGGIRL